MRSEEGERAVAISSLRRRLGVMTVRCQAHCHHLADRNDNLGGAAASRWRPRRREGGLKVSICHEKILLHPQLGDQPSRDFCTSCRDGNPDSWCRFFSNKLQQKLINFLIR